MIFSLKPGNYLADRGDESFYGKTLNLRKLKEIR